MSSTLSGLPEEHEHSVTGYCVHCRSRRLMQGAIQVCNRRGRYDLKGHCVVCGRSMYRLGGWESVAAAAEAQRVAQEGLPADDEAATSDAHQVSSKIVELDPQGCEEGE